MKLSDKFKNIKFKNIWWGILVTLGLIYAIFGFPAFKLGSTTSVDVFIFVIWICLLLLPLFQEIDIFGIKLKKEVDSLKSEMKEQIINLRSDMLSISIKNQVTQQTNLVFWGVGQKPEPIIDKEKRVVETHLGIPRMQKIKVNTEDFMREEGIITAMEEKEPENKKELEITQDALKVLSTLWNHQQQYYPRIWTFAVGSLNPNYPIYASGAKLAMLHGLVDINLENGQIFLTDAGIEYCKSHQDEMKSDWNYERWKSPV